MKDVPRPFLPLYFLYSNTFHSFRTTISQITSVGSQYEFLKGVYEVTILAAGLYYMHYSKRSSAKFRPLVLVLLQII